MVLVKKYRSKAKVWAWNPWNIHAEAGDLMVDFNGRLFRLTESKGRNKAAMGELTPKLIKPPLLGLYAKIIDDAVWWVKK